MKIYRGHLVVLSYSTYAVFIWRSAQRTQRNGRK